MDGVDGPRPPLCPSAPPEMAGAVVFGVVGGTATERRVGYLARPLPVTIELLELTAPAGPGAVLRVAAPCAGSGCAHFDGADCRLASRLVAGVDPAVDAVPPCRIRPDCRWWRQEGTAACLRCPQVASEIPLTSEALAAAGDPTVYGR